MSKPRVKLSLSSATSRLISPTQFHDDSWYELRLTTWMYVLPAMVAGAGKPSAASALYCCSAVASTVPACVDVMAGPVPAAVAGSSLNVTKKWALESCCGCTGLQGGGAAANALG